MQLQQQIITLPQAKRLKELGVRQESIFYYTEEGNVIAKTTLGYTTLGCESPIGAPDYWDEDPDGEEYFAAFTVAELGLMLPKGEAILPNDGHSWSYYHRNNCKGHSIGYSAYKQKSIEQGWYENEAESRAAMLIYLLENNLITASEVNERLK